MNTTIIKPIKAWLTLYSGKRIAIEELAEDQLDLNDIIHALSNICRYNGHCVRFYSVAEHSVRLYIECPNELKSAALIHDFSEAYINDITSFLKRKFAPDICIIEERIQRMIYHKMEVDYKLYPLLKPYESRLLATEVRDLLNSAADFVESTDNGPAPLAEPYLRTIYPVAPYSAESSLVKAVRDAFGYII